jgi:exopolysaccharide biosynthesis polyprenyl glycosylphosphotransferase
LNGRSGETQDGKRHAENYRFPLSDEKRIIPALLMDTQQAYRAERPVSWPRGDSSNGELHAAAGSGTRTTETRSRSVFGHQWAPAVLFLLLDMSCWILIYGAMSFFRGNGFYSTALQFFLVDVLSLAVIIQALFVVGGYDRNTQMRSLTYGTEHILALISAAVFSSFLIYSAATFDDSMKPSRGVLLLSFLVFLPVSIAYRRWIQGLVTRTSATKVFLVIGAGETAVRFYNAYKASPNRQQLEFVDLECGKTGRPITSQVSSIRESDLAAKLENLDGRYSGIILAERPNLLKPELLDRLVRTQFQQTRVYTLESFYETHWRYVPLDAIDPVWPLQTGFQLARISPYYYLKRLCDIAFASSALAICAPLMAIVALIVWVGSGRPVLFSQSRVGRENSIFTIHKFRTMVSRDSPNLDDIYTREGDPRITRVGRWLRKLRLDELPQFWNVLKGDMSLIGPRAEWDKCVECYEKKIPFYHFRHLVKPGITGWAQVNYPYGESDEDAIEKLKYDLYYIRHYSLKLDAMIVLKTVHVMLFSKGR